MPAARPGVRPGPWSLLLRLLLVAPVFVSGACVGPLPNPFQRQRADQVQLQVENHNWSNMTISVIRGGARARLGDIGTNQTRTFTLPLDLSVPGLSMRFEADPLGSNRVYRSEQITVSGGETWVWVLHVQIEQSSLYIR